MEGPNHGPARLLLWFAHRLRHPPSSVADTLLDKEKRKYFKIQASGSAPANSAYSNQDVKRRKLRDERDAATAREKQRQKGRIRHPRILEEPLTGGILRRECGHGNVDSAKVFAGGLVRRGYVPQAPVNPLDQESSPMFTICHRPDLGACVVDVAGGKLC